MMLRRLWSAVFGGVAGIAVVLTAAALPVLAATSPSTGGNGLKVSPVTTNLVIEPGQTQTVKIYIQNVTSSQTTLQAVVNDFVAGGDESGTPALLLNSQYAPSHSLKRYIAPIDPVTLAPGQQTSVSAVISIPKDVSGGGYFGAVRFVPTAASGSNSNVTLSASVGSLILVRVPGDVKEQLYLASIDVRDGEKGGPRVLFTSNKGIVAMVRFQNKGDVQEQPFGKMLLQQGGKTIGTYELNNVTPRGNVLPDSIRKFSIALDKVGPFGKYTLVGNFGFGTNGQLLSGETTFYVVPLGGMLLGILAIGLVLFGIFGVPRLIRAYNRRILRSAGRR